MRKFTLFALLILVDLSSQQSWAQNAKSLWVAYNCEASDVIEFAAGDRKVETVSSQVQWVLKEPDSVNLVIGNHEFLLRPHVGKSQGTFEITLMQKFFGEGYRAIETKDLGPSETAFDMKFRNAYAKDVMVKCVVSSNLP